MDCAVGVREAARRHVARICSPKQQSVFPPQNHVPVILVKIHSPQSTAPEHYANSPAYTYTHEEPRGLEIVLVMLSRR